MENKRRKSYFIVKEEKIDQTGAGGGAGNLWFRYRAPGVFPGMVQRDPSMVGLYASPMMNRPEYSTDSVEIARSIGKIRGNPTKTFPGSIMGSPYPGTVTIPNRPYGFGMPIMPSLGTPCGVSPCGQQRIMGVPGFGAVAVRKGEFTAGTFDIAPVYPYSTYGFTSNQQATIKLTFGDRSYTVKLPYIELNKIISKLDANKDSADDAIRIEINVPIPTPTSNWLWPNPINNWSWPARIRSRSIDTVADMFKELSEVKDVKFQDASGKDLTSKDVVDQIIAEFNKKDQERKTKLSEQSEKSAAAVKKLSEAVKAPEPKPEEKSEKDKKIEELEKELAGLRAARAAEAK